MERLPKLSHMPAEAVPAFIKIGKALSTLEREQGSRARRNARARLTAALRTLKAAVDASYPAPPRKAGKRSRSISLSGSAAFTHRQRRILAGGFVSLMGNPFATSIVAACASAGVRVKLLPRPPGWSGPSHVSYVPAWVEVIGADVSKLSRAKRDIMYRKALVTELTLLRTAQDRTEGA